MHTVRQVANTPYTVRSRGRNALSSGSLVDADAQAWLNRGASANQTKADAVFRALKAVGFTSSNAYADIKAAGGTIQLFRGLSAGGATIPDLTGNFVATPSNSPTFNAVTGYTLNGTTQSIDAGYKVAANTSSWFGIIFCNHITFTNNDGLFSDADATTPAISSFQRTGNIIRTTVTKTDASTTTRDTVAAISTGIDYQHGILIGSNALQPYSNVVSAEAFVPDNTSTTMSGLSLRASDGNIKLGRAGTGYANIQVHAFIAAPLLPTAAQLQNLCDAMEVFWS